MQGRVFTLIGSASAAMMPLSLALAGPIADIIGVRTWFLIGGLATLALCLIAPFIPSLVNIERDRDDFVEETGRVAVPHLTPVVKAGRKSLIRHSW